MGLFTGILDALRGRSAQTIEVPVLGLLNLEGEAGRACLDEDRATLAPLFSTVRVSDGPVPACDVLFIYVHLTSSGEMTRVPAGTRSLVRDSGAKITVFALDNPGSAYNAAGSAEHSPPTNLVMTISRNGRAFPAFWRGLFQDMRTGTPMMMAWTKLAPQMPGNPGGDVPALFCAVQLGGLRFRGITQLG